MNSSVRIITAIVSEPMQIANTMDKVLELIWITSNGIPGLQGAAHPPISRKCLNQLCPAAATRGRAEHFASHGYPKGSLTEEAS